MSKMGQGESIVFNSIIWSLTIILIFSAIINFFFFFSFDEFLMDMKQSKRKNIRQERKKVGSQISYSHV